VFFSFCGSATSRQAATWALAADNGHVITIKYLRRLKNGISGSGLGTTIN
jgi:hypothetical protein